jgi:hypothetical protein
LEIFRTESVLPDPEISWMPVWRSRAVVLMSPPDMTSLALHL